MTTDTRPLVSVLIAAYNCADSVVATVLSVLAEREVPLQVVVVDDASTDATPRVLDWLHAYDERVTVVHRAANGGEGPCRASGMDAVTGTWLLMLDADDLIVPGSLAKLAPYLRETTADVILSSHYRYDVPTQVLRKVSLAKVGPAVPKGPFAPEELCESLLTRAGSGIANKVFRMERIRSEGVRFQDVPRIGDVAFTLGALATARLVEFVDIPHYHYRVRLSTSLTHAGVRYPLSFAQACYGIKDFLVSKGLWETWRIGFLNWLVALLPYNLSMMESYESCHQLAAELYDHGFAYLEFGVMEPDQCLHPKRYEVCRALYEHGPEQGIYTLMRLNRSDYENMEMRHWATQQTLTGVRSDLKAKNARIKKLETQVRGLQDDLRAVWGSQSMRIGRAITSAPRTLRDLARRGAGKVADAGAAAGAPVVPGSAARDTADVQSDATDAATPLASFVIPVRQDAPQLSACLASIAGQDCPSFEVLVVDVGMSAAARSTVDALARTDQRFRVIGARHDDLVAAAAAGAAVARGDWVCLVAAGDYLYPEFLGATVGLAVGEDAQVGTCAMGRFAKKPALRRVQAFEGVRVGDGVAYLADDESDGSHGLAWGKVFRRASLVAAEAPGFAMQGDELACQAVLEACDTIVESGFEFYAHRG